MYNSHFYGDHCSRDPPKTAFGVNYGVEFILKKGPPVKPRGPAAPHLSQPSSPPNT